MRFRGLLVVLIFALPFSASAQVTVQTDNLTAFGLNAGTNTTPLKNSFFGASAGNVNAAGFQNSFLGYFAGKSNTDGAYNSFMGAAAGYSNSLGQQNSFFGSFAGYSNVSGIANSFFGQGAGVYNTSSHNSFFGDNAGNSHTTGSYNSFFGHGAGLTSTNESYNSILGSLADTSAGISNSTAIGYRAKVTQSNSLVLGSISGVNGATASTRVGIGTTSPASPLHVFGTFKVIQSSSPNDTTGIWQQFNTSDNTGFGYFGVEGSTSGVIVTGTSPYATLLASGSSGSALQLGSAGYIRMTISRTGNVGIGTASPTAQLHVVGGVLADGYSVPSDARLKQDIEPLAYGLDEILHLQPVSFYWKDRDDHRLNLGLIAQEAATVIPEIVENHNDSAGTLGLNYGSLIPVLIKAVQEQQAELEKNAKEISELKTHLSALKETLERLAKQPQ